ISELKKLIENCKGKSVETQFNKPSVVRQPNAQRIPKPSVLGKPTPFSNSPEMRSFQTKQSVNKTNVSDGLFKHVTQQNLPQIRKQAVRNTNVNAPGPSRNCLKHVSHQSPREKVGSNDMVHNYYLEKAKKSAQLQKDKEVNGKPSMIDPARLPNTANGRILKTVGLRWVPTGKLFNSCTSKVESEPTHGSNVDIHHIHACKQTLGLSAETSARMVSQKMKSSAMTFEHSSSSLGHQCQMMSDHNSSDLAPQRQEMSVENVSSGLVPQGQKASDYDNSDPVPPRQNVVPTAEKTDSSQQGLEFLFSPLLKEYYNPAHGHAEENNNDQAPNASFQEAEFINPFCTRVQEIGESSSRNIDNTDVHSFQPQSHDYRWTRDHPLEQVRGNPTMPVQTRRQLATDPEMCMFALTIHQSPKGIFINQAKYALEILKKHNMDNCHSIGTPLATKPKLDVDLSGEPVDQSDYRSKIGSLMYLTSSRPDLVQAIFRRLIMTDAIDTRKRHSGGYSSLVIAVSLGCQEKNYTENVLSRGRVVALSASCAKKEALTTNLRQKPGSLHMLSESQMIVGIENNIDPMMQCTTLQQFEFSSQQKLSPFVHGDYNSYLLTSHSEIVDIE
ncbi:uncharacterized mitochondrial protein-like protein, partial [Tanacetum coccineum]